MICFVCIERRVIVKISSRVECGIIALIDIEMNSKNGKTVTVSNISERNNISAKYLEQIIPSLRQANLIRSIKGSRGGYVIARPSSTITFREIIDALDLTILSDVVVDDLEQGSTMKTAINNCLWDKMTDFLQNFAQNLTLSDAVASYSELVANNTSEPMYYI